MKNPPELGKLAPADGRRDAIHVAVVPVEAASLLAPGQRVALNDEGRAVPIGKPVGIVDPFLDDVVRPGERLWLCLFPNTVTSLRHEWTHPAFPEASAPAGPAEAASVEESRRWLQDFAERTDLTYDQVIEAGTNYLEYGDCFTQRHSSAAQDEMYAGNNAQLFWMHFRTVTGMSVQGNEESNPFSCSC